MSLQPPPPRPQISPEQAKEIHIRQFAEMLYAQMVIEEVKSCGTRSYKEIKNSALAAAEAFVNE